MNQVNSDNFRHKNFFSQQIILHHLAFYLDLYKNQRYSAPHLII